MTLAAALAALTLAHPHYPPPGPPPSQPPPPPGYAQPVSAGPRGMVGLVLMPFGVSELSYGDSQVQGDAISHAAAALELRAPYSGARLRFGAELTRHDRIVDVSLKYNFMHWSPLQPFLSLGVGAARLGPEDVWRGTASASAGIDFFLTRELFLTAEAKGRLFSDLGPTDPQNLNGNGLGMTTALFGIGMYF